MVMRHYALDDMALTKCNDCGRDVSTSAAACPNCGCPIQGAPVQSQSHTGSTCPHCGSHSVGKVRGLQGIGEVFIAIILFFLCIIPGIIYYIYMESVPYCSGWGRRVCPCRPPMPGSDRRPRVAVAIGAPRGRRR